VLLNRFNRIVFSSAEKKCPRRYSLYLSRVVGHGLVSRTISALFNVRPFVCDICGLKHYRRTPTRKICGWR